MSKWELLRALTAGCGEESEVMGVTGAGKVRLRGLVQGVEREDGSGRCFNVAVLVGSVVHKVFVKTLD